MKNQIGESQALEANTIYYSTPAPRLLQAPSAGSSFWLVGFIKFCPMKSKDTA